MPIPALAEELAGNTTLLTLTAHRTAGRLDLTYPSHWAGTPAPVGMAVGTQAVAEIGVQHVRDTPILGQFIGPAASPGAWFQLTDGDPPGDADAEPWATFNALMSHLRSTAP